jgi:hypothetical protein
MASNEQEASESVFDLLEGWTGTKWKGSIQYAQNYDLSTALDDINDLISLQSAGLPKTGRQELMRRVIAKKMPNLREDKNKAIQAEIDAMDEIPDLPEQMQQRNDATAAGADAAGATPGTIGVTVKPMQRPVDRSNRPLVEQPAGSKVQPPAA